MQCVGPSGPVRFHSPACLCMATTSGVQSTRIKALACSLRCQLARVTAIPRFLRFVTERKSSGPPPVRLSRGLCQCDDHRHWQHIMIPPAHTYFTAQNRQNKYSEYNTCFTHDHASCHVRKIDRGDACLAPGKVHSAYTQSAWVQYLDRVDEFSDKLGRGMQIYILVSRIIETFPSR